MAETGTWSDYQIIQAGRDLRQQAIAEGKKVVFTRAVIGTGKPADSSDIDTMTGLVAYAKDVVIKKSYAIEANHLCIVRVDNSGYTQTVLMTEVGVYAKIEDQADADAILYGYSYNLDGYVEIPAQTSQTNRKIYEITLDSYLGRATDIRIIYDETGLWVSHADLDDFISTLMAMMVGLNNPNFPGLTNVDQALDLLATEKANISDLMDKQWTPLPLRSGFAGSMKYALDRFGYVWLEGQVLKGGSGVDFGDVFADIPVGLRPESRASIPVTLVNGASPNNTFDMGVILIYADGSIKLGKPLAAVGISGGAPVVTNVSYKAVQ